MGGNKFMPEMHLKQSVFTYNACGPFTNDKERIEKFMQTIEKFMQTGNTGYIYKNDLDKSCFQNYMAYGRYKDLNKRTK